MFGEGPAQAPLFLLGEQPGDREDIEGHPFVGPAGELLGRALDDAGIRREDAFVSNVVKHFKWKPQGKRRLHDRPNASEIRACRPWLDLELDLVRPEVLVLLGATAANAVLGPRFRLTEQRGTLLDAGGRVGPLRIATFHPSAVLRARDAEARRTTYEALVADLAVARQRLDLAGRGDGLDEGHERLAPLGVEAALHGERLEPAARSAGLTTAQAGVRSTRGSSVTIAA